MNVCRIEDIAKIGSENNINQAINGMFYLLDASEAKINAIKNQNWFQRMIFSVFGKNKASLKEIEENKDKINKYVAEAITEMYKRNMISESYIVSLGNRINEISLSNAHLKRQLLELGMALNEKIESVDHYHVLRGLIDEGKFSDYPELYTLIFITSSCDKRVLTDDDHVWLLEKSLKKAGMLCKDLNIADELKVISKLPEENVEGILIETSRTVFNQSLKEIFCGLDSLNSSDRKSSDLVISGEKLFNLLIEDKKNYFSFLENKKQEQLAEAGETSDGIDLANVVGVYNKNLIPTRGDFLKKRELEGILVIEDKTTVSNEEIHIKNQIKCNATFCIEDSIIYINENIYGNIEILNGATLVFKNCLIVGNDIWRRPFIKISKGFFFSENSIYEDCSSFINVECGTNDMSDSIVELNYCEGVNCGPGFIDNRAYGGFVELNNCSFSWKEDTETYNKFITKLEKFDFLNSTSSGKYYVKNCSFIGNSFNSIWEEGGFISGGENIIEGCIFKNISGDIESSTLRNSSFKMLNHSNLKIKEMSFCEFADCANLCVEGYFEGGVNIEGCSFEKIDNSDSWRSELINVRRDKGGNLNVIRNCTFSNINSVYEIINPQTFDAPKDIIVLSIEKCKFVNCKPERAEIIKTATCSYTFMLGRKIEHKKTVMISGCIGL